MVNEQKVQRLVDHYQNKSWSDDPYELFTVGELKEALKRLGASSRYIREVMRLCRQRGYS